jgi:hypothetical protein
VDHLGLVLGVLSGGGALEVFDPVDAVDESGRRLRRQVFDGIGEVQARL